MTHVPDQDVSAGTTEPVPPSRRGRRREQLPIWQEMALLLGIALVLAIVIKAFLMQAFYIPSASMNDTLVKNDRILVQKVSYWGSAGPHRGDIVVFYTDGITERESEQGEWFGVERLEQTVIAHRAEDAARLVASVLAAVDGFAGNKPPVDDATIVAMKAIE